MGFTVVQEGAFNPFEWSDMACPVCKGGDFTSVSHSAVYCDDCNVEFKVRATAGDPGCVVDCLVERSQIIAPAWHCTQCDSSSSFNHIGCFDNEKPTCPKNPEHKMERLEGMRCGWSAQKDAPPYYYLILKKGDYCSGWLDHRTQRRLDFPTQKQWEKFQKHLPHVLIAQGKGIATAILHEELPESLGATDYRVVQHFLEKYQPVFEQGMRDGGMEVFRAVLNLLATEDGKLPAKVENCAYFDDLLAQITKQSRIKPMLTAIRRVQEQCSGVTPGIDRKKQTGGSAPRKQARGCDHHP